MLRSGQRGGLCRAIVAASTALQQRDLFTDEGPTAGARELAAADTLASREQTLLRAALDVWDGSGSASVGDVVGLGKNDLRRVADVLGVLASGDPDDAAALLEGLAFQSEGPTVRAKPLR